MKVLLAGQGLAGSVLAMECLRRGFSVLVIGRELPGAASPVAAGVFNPITGRKPVETWLAGTLFPFLAEYYPRLEAQLGARFYFHLPNFRPLQTPDELAQAEAWVQNLALVRWARLAPPGQLVDQTLVKAPFGGLVVDQAGYVEVGDLVAAVRSYLQGRGIFEDGLLTLNDLTPSPSGYRYKGEVFDKVIFCTGRWADRPGMAPLKGEILRVQSVPPSPQPFSHAAEGVGLLNVVVNRAGYVAPRPDGTWWAGSTYQHHFAEEGPTDAGRDDILSRIGRSIVPQLEVLEHRAGIRPSVRDRRPIVGFQSADPRIGYFTGLGTKGVSLAPYFAHLLCQHLAEGVPLPPEVDVNRFG